MYSTEIHEHKPVVVGVETTCCRKYLIAKKSGITKINYKMNKKNTIIIVQNLWINVLLTYWYNFILYLHSHFTPMCYIIFIEFRYLNAHYKYAFILTLNII